MGDNICLYEVTNNNKRRCLLQFHNSYSIFIKPGVKKEKNFFNLDNHKAQLKKKEINHIMSDKSQLTDKSSVDSKENLYYYTPGFSYVNLPLELYGDTESSFSSNSNQTNSNKNNFPYKLADILSATGFFGSNHSIISPQQNFSECICKPLGFQNVSDISKCCCSKEMQQKCEGVDLSYLLPIPGDTTTINTTAISTVKSVVSGSSTITSTISSILNDKSTIIGPKLDITTNARGYRKVEESTLDALRRFQLTHGIFAPNEEEMEKAVEKAKIQLFKVKNKLPEWYNYFKQEDGLVKGLKENCLDKGKMIKDESELYKLLPQFKIEKIVNQQKSLPEVSSHNEDISLLYQNAAAIKNQLETIRQYDILLANIRAQAQLRLIELADIEAKHRVEEVRYKKEREHGLDELKKMEDVLRQEVKLARNLPGAESNWAELQELLSTKNINSNLNEIDVKNYSPYGDSRNAEIIQEAVNRNNKILEELDTILHGNNHVAVNKDINISLKNYRRNLANDKTEKINMLTKALGRTVRNNPKFDDSIIKNIKNNNISPKRKCIIKRTIDEHQTGGITDYGKAFHNLKSDIMELKNHLLTKSELTSEPQDNVLVQIKVSVDVANTTDSNRSRREATPIIVDNNKQIKKINKVFQKSKFK